MPLCDGLEWLDVERNRLSTEPRTLIVRVLGSMNSETLSTRPVKISSGKARLVNLRKCKNHLQTVYRLLCCKHFARQKVLFQPPYAPASLSGGRRFIAGNLAVPLAGASINTIARFQKQTSSQRSPICVIYLLPT